MNAVPFVNPDLHMHSSASDGSDTPAELLEKVKSAGIDVFSLTDHDTYLGCGEIQKLIKPGDPLFIGGIELSCVDEGGKYHILGYCYNPDKPSIKEAAGTVHAARREKALHRIEFLQNVHGFSFTDEELNSLLENENPGKPHFVALLLKKGYVENKAAGFALMDEYHGKERRLTPAEAIDAILEADGIPVLAHGILADGSKQLSEDEISERVVRLKEHGLMGLECYYSRYTEEQTALMLRLAEENNLMVTAGSDYHGTNKPVRLGETGGPDPQKMARFYRAAQRLLNLRT